MSFNQQSWGRISGSANNDVVTLQDGSYSGAPNIFSYISATDTLAQIAAANYFLPVFNELNVNDLIYAAGTDGVDFLQVLTVSNTGVTVGVNTAGGDVSGPSSSTNNDFVLFNGATGKLVKDSGFSVVPGANGGTGVANTGKTITLGGNLTTSGAFATTFTMTAATGVTFPTSGTLATTTNQIKGLSAGYTVIAGVTGVYGGGGTANDFAVTGIDATYAVVASLATSTNVVSVKAVAGSAVISATFSADPGAGTTLSYWAFK